MVVSSTLPKPAWLVGFKVAKVLKYALLKSPPLEASAVFSIGAYGAYCLSYRLASSAAQTALSTGCKVE